jgi:hypothetical protein
MQTDRVILRGVGWVLVVSGAIDTCLMVLCIAKGTDYFLGLGIPALIGGVLLLKGSLGAARVITFLSALLLAVLVLGVVGVFVLLPIDLLAVHARIRPGTVAVDITRWTLAVALLGWVYRRLMLIHRRVHSNGDRAKGNRLRWTPNWGFWIGGLFVAGFCIVVILISGSARFQKAEEMAAREVGPGYRFRVRSVELLSTDGRTQVRAIVTAYSSQEIKWVTVSWTE